jgi:hypothetical protein
VPAFVTVIEDVVAPLLHKSVPAADVDKVEVPQLLTTATTGVEGSAFGTATPEPAGLIQLPTVWVTV